LKEQNSKSELEGKMQGIDSEEWDVKATLHGQIKLVEKDIDKEKLEANLHGLIKEKKLPEKDADKEQLENALRQIKEPKNKIMEKDSDRATLEVKLHQRIRELEAELQETDILKKELESAICSQREYY
jgi:BioD-like phosphotransacetylase family protein